MTVHYAEVIGDPIAQSKSPVIHRFWLKQLGIEGDYRLRRVTQTGLPSYLRLASADHAWVGCNVTIPHKQAILPLIDRLSAAAEAVGAVNVVYRDGRTLVGANSDVFGVQAAIGKSARGKVVCLIGAGGAARAALAVLKGQELAGLRILARNRDKVGALLDDIGIPASVLEFESAWTACEGAALVINASPLGMQGKPPVPPTLMRALDATQPDATVFDMVYDPLDTALLAAARRRGRKAVDGLVMLVGQARLAFRHFYGAEAPDDAESNARLRALLTAE